MRTFVIVLVVLSVVGAFIALVAGSAAVAAIVLPNLRQAWEAGDLHAETRNIEVGGAQSAKAEFRIGCGSLVLRGGADRLMDAEFTYNVAKWRPEVAYAVNGGKGRLTAKQPSGGSVRGNARNEWNIRLGNGVPIDLAVNTGVGGATLDLEGVDVASLDLNVGAGTHLIKLPGEYPSLRRISVSTGVGNVTLDLSGRYPLLSEIDVDGGTGNLKIDLTGEWKHDAAVTIDAGVGKASLRLPKDVGVRVAVDTGIGKVSGSGMMMDGKAFVNDLYGRSETNLNVTLNHGVGDVVLDLER